MIGLFFGDSDFPIKILNKIKKYKKNILLLIFLLVINLKKIKILTEYPLDNLVRLLTYLIKKDVKRCYLLEKLINQNYRNLN